MFHQALYTQKYAASLVQPGETVGVIAGQSIGEPSTQLTLNTFHLAGHGAANVTLGIPRLRQIIMAATKDIPTPLITVRCSNIDAAQKIKQTLAKVQLSQAVQKVSLNVQIKDNQNVVEARISLSGHGARTNDAMRGFCSLLTRLITQRIKQILSTEIQQNAVEAPVQGNAFTGAEDGDKTNESDNESSSELGSEQEVVRVVQDSEQMESLSNKYVTHHGLTEQGDDYIVKFAVNTCYPVLFLTYIEEAIQRTTLSETKGISEVYIREEGGEIFCDIQGKNISAVACLERSLCDTLALKSNNIWEIHEVFGVEAARQAIIQEVGAVFSVYSISVDQRHLELIADYMTQLGGFRPCNRAGIALSCQPLGNAMFETAAKFIVEGALYELGDNLKQPSTAVAVGQLPAQGTGCFGVLQEMGEE